jgi:hypothetical protein
MTYVARPSRSSRRLPSPQGSSDGRPTMSEGSWEARAVTTQKADYRRLPAGARTAGLALGSEASQHDIRKRP